MNIYIENRGFLGNLRLIWYIRRHFGEDNRITLINHSPISAMHLMALLSNRKALRHLTVTIQAKHLLKSVVRLCNSSDILDLVILTDSPLTKAQWKRICGIEGLIRIVDGAGEDNRAFYEGQRRILWTSPKLPFLEQDALGKVCTGERAYGCPGENCLYIDRKNRVCLCPMHPGENQSGKLDFRKAPPKPQGLCPFGQIPETLLEEARRERDDILQNRPDLASLPLHKELAILGFLCRKD